jgi:hypothetical protein
MRKGTHGWRAVRNRRTGSQVPRGGTGNAGFEEHLVKPVDADRLVEHVTGRAMPTRT